MHDLERTYNLAARLVTCACAALDDAVTSCPPRRGIVPGDVPESINCCAGGGQLTVNILRNYPSRTFPVQDLDRNNCDTPYTVVIYNVQVMRCLPVGDVTHAPTVDALDKAAFTQAIDMEAVRIGVICCMRSNIDSITGGGHLWLLGEQRTVIDGNCTGSTLELSVGFMTCQEC